MSVEECQICTEDLGVPGRPAAQLPCGHAFCACCVLAWVKEGHRDCPSCRVAFKLSKLRELVPWEGGLKLKEASSAEQNALKELEEARSARAAMEQRAAAAERALRQHQLEVRAAEQRERQRAAEEAAAAERRAIAAAAAERRAETPVAGAGAGAAAGATAAAVDTAAHEATILRPLPAAQPPPPPQTPAAAAAPPPPPPLSAVTDAQRQRAEANRLKALERKRERDAAAAATDAAGEQPAKR